MAVPPERVTAPEASTVVNAPAAGVTLPIMPWNDVPVATPKTGVTKVGEVAKTAEPLPVSSVKAAARLAELGVAKNVATFVPRPDTPVLMGKPVAFVNVAKEGTPRLGVTSVGEFDNTTLVVPVLVVTPVPPLATPKVPVMSAVERLTASQEAFVPSV